MTADSPRERCRPAGIHATTQPNGRARIKAGLPGSWAGVPVLCLALLVLAAPAVAQQKERLASLAEALGSSAALSGGAGPQNVVWIEGGKRFSFVVPNAQSGRSEIRAMDPATGRDSLLFDGQGVSFPDGQPFEYESFQWSADSKQLVFQTGFHQLYRRSGTADWYVYTLADRSLRPAARGARTAQLSPDGTKLGYERDGNLFAWDMTRAQERQLTDDAHGSVYNGHFDWVYEEEFGQAQAWTWSADSRWIAYWQTDEGEEPYIQLTDYAGRHPQWDSIRIPQPGDRNGKVRIGVVDVATGRRLFLDPGESGEFYIPRIYWTSEPNTLAMLVLDRPQTGLELFVFDVTTGARRPVMSQKADAWIDVYDFYAGVNDLMTFPAGMKEFFWISDRDGHQHIYRYGYDGKLIQQVTKGDWNVTRVEGIDTKNRTIWFTSTNPSPLERQLWSIRFDGSNLRRITKPHGRHSIDMSPDARFYIDRWSSTTQPRRVELWSASNGRLLRSMDDNARVDAWLETHAYSPVKLFDFTTSDGTRLDGSMVLPVPFDSTQRYPVVMAIYGGPGSQQVYDAFDASGWTQWLAQQGYIVVGLNNRGTANYSRDFMKIVYRDLGHWEANDFAEAAKWLGGQRYVDGSRIAIMGTSYGGYSTVFSMLAKPDVFRVGIANSPVTDWRLYDTIYTERYMGLLEDNPGGYSASSAVENAAKLAGRLLLVHSMMDDNVHPINTMQLLTALTNAGRDVDLRIFPPGAHGAAWNASSFMLMYRTYFQFLEQHLKGRGPNAGVSF